MNVTLTQKILMPNASKQLKSLRPVFKQLLLVHQDYINGEPPGDNGELDFPYWYGERAHIGFLAAAVWQYSGTALEEYRSNKTKERKSKLGRGDLHIRINKKIAFECEAKRLWLNLGGKPEIWKRNFDDELGGAEGNVKDLPSRKGLALCFLIPTIKESKVHTLLEKRLKDLKDELEQKLHEREYDALVWIGIAKGQKTPIGDDDKFAYPGVFLAIKEVS